MSSIPGDFAINGCRCADSECEHRQELILELPKKKEDRVKGQLYMKNDDKVIWNGRRLHCEHGKRKSHCKECGGSSFCELLYTIVSFSSPCHYDIHVIVNKIFSCASKKRLMPGTFSPHVFD